MHLLVSVRSVEEARLVAAHGVDLVDLKEPRLGSLGPTSVETWQAVVGQWHRQTRVSLALGELPDVALADQVPPQTDSVKIGLAGCCAIPNWQDTLAHVFNQLPDGVQRVAVFYADTELAHSPPLADVLNEAVRLDCQTFLVDTFDKSAGSVFNYMSTMQLKKLRQRLHAVGIQFALAGSLRAEHLPSVVQIQPNIVAVRGAVCHHDRTGEIDVVSLRSFQNQIKRAFQIDTRKVHSRS